MIPYALLEGVFKRLLSEGMKTVSDLHRENIKLVYTKTAMGGVRITLYKIVPNEYASYEAIAYIAISNEIERCGAWKVASVASAVPGYGPLMYDLGMSVVYPDYIRADDPVRESAKNIWNNILGSYRSKYEIVPMEYDSYCETGLDRQVKVRIIDPIDYEPLQAEADDYQKRNITDRGIDLFKKRYAATKPKN
jgi:hypothetical protein